MESKKIATYQLPFGNTFQELHLPGNIRSDWIVPPEQPIPEEGSEIVLKAIQNPLSSIVFPKEIKSVGIVINDKTRPVPLHILLPPLFTWLKDKGFLDDQIKIFIATGTHKPPTKQEMESIIPPEIGNSYQILCHDCDDIQGLEYLGTTSRKTPVWVNSSFYHADLKILIGNLEPHHFAGFSGGNKSASIGLCGRETINHNHAFLQDPSSKIGAYEDNPLRQDIEEIGDLIGSQLCLNVVMNYHKQILEAFWGGPRKVMQAGVPIAKKVFQTQVKTSYDIVIASAGGLPKDINFYQAQKAITHASLITKESGTIILVAACPEGTGSLNYENFMKGLTTHPQVLEKFEKMGFQTGPHKAYQIALQAIHKRIILVSSMEKETVQSLILEPAKSVDEAYQMAALGNPDLSVALLPKATSTIPVLLEQ